MTKQDSPTDRTPTRPDTIARPLDAAEMAQAAGGVLIGLLLPAVQKVR